MPFLRRLCTISIPKMGMTVLSDGEQNPAVSSIQQAIAALERSLADAPRDIGVLVKLAALQLQLGRHRKAMELYRQAVELDPHLHNVCRDTTNILNEELRCKAVVENCAHILTRYPSYAPAHFGKAMALLTMGRVDEARRAAEHALVIDPTVPDYYHVLIQTGDPTRNANAIAALEQLEAQKAALDAQDCATLHFLLAKAREDAKRHDEAFAHYAKANAIKRSLIAYDEAHELGRMRAIAAAFTPGRIRELQGAGDPNASPIFVVGMPRSGTTLVEQILASHPNVHGAGELDVLPGLVAKGAAGTEFPLGFGTLGQHELRRLGEAYLAKTAALAPRTEHIVDKHPYNFLHAGLIHLALPGARIIHVKRDALDTCFSCYATTFAGEVGFAYDLTELGRYYTAYRVLMAHWRQVLPESAMLEIQYEELVKDLPGTVSRLIEFCGLEWNAHCLEFHKAQRAVATASLYQVRQPLYQRSVGRAQAYVAHLSALREALGPL